MEAHVAGGRSYRRNKHVKKRLDRWHLRFNRVLCPTTAISTTSTITTTTSTLTTTTTTEPETCGCYDKDIETPIENNKCALSLGSFTDFQFPWGLTFQLKIHSVQAEKTHIMSGLGLGKNRKVRLITSTIIALVTKLHIQHF